MSAAFLLDAGLCLLILAAALLAMTGRDLFGAIAFFIVYGIMIALAWVRLGAPDVALAEAAIGAGLTGILLLGAVGIVLGLVTFGRRVIATVGTQITDLTPSRGFAATLAAAGVVVIASGTGLPISTTHTLVGAVLGVGLARGIAALNLTVIRNIFMSWIITLPAGAFLSILFFWCLTAIL